MRPALVAVSRRPVFFAVAVLLGFLLAIAVSDPLGATRDDAVGMMVEGGTRVVIAVACCVVASFLGWRELGFAAPKEGRGWALFALPFLYLGVVYPLLFTGSLAPNLEHPRITALIAADAFMSGLAEDLAFRGLIFFTMVIGWRERPDALRRAVIASSVFFALPHALNLLAGHQLLRVCAQILWAFVLGAAIALLAWMVRSVWPGALLHGLLDAVVHTNRMGKHIELSLGRATALVLVSLPVLGYALWLRRRSSSDDPPSRPPAPAPAR